jgi:4-hydroxy-3-methylbut-2-enyl diphosphate reductase
MRIIRADEMGMCFGVKDALHVAEQIDDPSRVTIYGQLVHNEAVLDRLDKRGFVQTPEDRRDQIPQTPLVLITAHGVSDSRRSDLEQAGKQIIDTTCPLVRKVHQAARRLADAGYHLLVIGRPGHVEVEGIIEDFDSFDVLPTADAVRAYPHRRLGIVCQTTMATDDVQAIWAQIQLLNPAAEIELVDTVCDPTRRRIEAARRLADEADAVVVVGGANSNNTRRLVELCESAGVRVFHVQGPEDLDAAKLAGCERIGLTAGTSTTDESIDRVYQALVELAS